MLHLIITRFGLGQSREVFYAKRIRYLKSLLIPSLALQTESNFLWIALHDSRLPPAIHRQLTHLSERFPFVRLWAHDPFKKWDLRPDIAEVVSRHCPDPSARVLTTRIDDDDAIHPNFCETVQTRASGLLTGAGVQAASISVARGIFYEPTASIAVEADYPGVSVMSVVSHNAREFNAYSEPHHKMHERMLNGGNEKCVIDSDAPLWFRTFRSDSEAGRGRRNAPAEIETKLRKKGFWLRQINVGEVLREFGFDVGLSETMRKIESEEPSGHANLLHERAPKLKRMQAKAVLLRMAKEAEFSDRLSPKERNSRLTALFEAFYAM